MSIKPVGVLEPPRSYRRKPVKQQEMSESNWNEYHNSKNANTQIDSQRTRQQRRKQYDAELKAKMSSPVRN